MARNPVVFVHGNLSSSEAWDPMVSHLRQHGYSSDELWCIDFDQPTPSHPEMATALDTYVNSVRSATGSRRVDVVAHSLGVTGTRWWMHVHDSYDRVENFVGLCGANHGLTSCKWAVMSGMDYGPFSVSQFLRSDYDAIDGHPLRVMNRDETRGQTNYYTIRGTDDRLFRFDPYSPRLCGAQNLAVDESHMGVLDSEVTCQVVNHWLGGARHF